MYLFFEGYGDCPRKIVCHRRKDSSHRRDTLSCLCATAPYPQYLNPVHPAHAGVASPTLFHLCAIARYLQYLNLFRPAHVDAALPPVFQPTRYLPHTVQSANCQTVYPATGGKSGTLYPHILYP